MTIHPVCVPYKTYFGTSLYLTSRRCQEYCCSTTPIHSRYKYYIIRPNITYTSNEEMY